MSRAEETSKGNFSDKHVVIVGAGITGLAAAHQLLQHPHPPRITIVDAADRIGGIIQASPFAGLDSVDESADAFLTRTPSAMNLAAAVGLDQQLTSPAANHAYIWNRHIHAIPTGTMLGIPASRKSIWGTPLLSTGGKLRASVEPFIPRSIGRSTDSLGAAIRSRCGNQVLERLVDPLVGSIYATDTDNFSVHGMPQVAELLAQPTSLMTAAHNALVNRTGSGAVFATPITGMSALTHAVHEKIVEDGARVVLSSPVHTIDLQGETYLVHLGNESLQADAVILASPARHTAKLVEQMSSTASHQLSTFEHASVIMIAMTIPRAQWPQHLTGTGYLVPKPVQTGVTAVSFGSNKWAHWKTTADEMILRVSLGRDGAPMHHLDDTALLEVALRDLRAHLGFDATPTNIRFTRWIESFPQYRPGHASRVGEIDKQLHAAYPGIVLAGASYRGIGIPACITDAQRAASHALASLLS
ncbi:MAG: protoporphyrinogen oxidase [Actinobacteria bacterium]|nr:MAG: protoporphyrinogen oxidase [Actinomycetota bacterium]